MCGFKCLGFFPIYIIIEYLLIFFCLFHQHSALGLYIVKLMLLFSIGFSILIIIIGFWIWILCCKKISLTYFCVTIQFCEMYIFLLEIEHSYYELLFVTPLFFFFSTFWFTMEPKNWKALKKNKKTALTIPLQGQVEKYYNGHLSNRAFMNFMILVRHKILFYHNPHPMTKL